MFLPTTKEEIARRGWDFLDVILVTGDTYIDSPYIGAAVIGRVLESQGYRVGIIAQPDVDSPADITRLGEPLLFWGVTAGAVDSLVANYTATKKFRNSDDLTPGGVNDRRPDRASMVYTNLIRRFYKSTVPIVLGGIEASLRRVAHYDYWDNKIRRSVLLDSKADGLVYGMGEKAIIQLAEALSGHKPWDRIPGTCVISKSMPDGCIELPSYEEVASDPGRFTEMFRVFYQNNDPITAKTLAQKHGDRWLVQNPPQELLSVRELDEVHGLPYERDVHPYYAQQGQVKALETIRFSITTHRGCYGECNFCAIAVHQGRRVVSRSEDSIIQEAELFTRNPAFKGIIQDVGGPTANMYGIECPKKVSHGACVDKSCLFPEVCQVLPVDHSRQIKLLERIRSLKGVRKAFVGSGIRYDLIQKDSRFGKKYLSEIVSHHVSGQLKVAPEHTEDKVLRYMKKPGTSSLMEFKRDFDALSLQQGKKQFLTYYLIAAHPGCEEKDMTAMKRFVSENLHLNPEQVQVFTPTPSTWSTLLYWTEKDPSTGKPVFVEKDIRRKENQKSILTTPNSFYKPAAFPGKRPEKRR